MSKVKLDSPEYQLALAQYNELPEVARLTIDAKMEREYKFKKWSIPMFIFSLICMALTFWTIIGFVFWLIVAGECLKYRTEKGMQKIFVRIVKKQVKDLGSLGLYHKGEQNNATKFK